MNRADTDIGTIIYIVLAVIAAIAGAFQKKQQKLPQKPVEQQHDDVEDEWEEVYTNTAPQKPATPIVFENQPAYHLSQGDEKKIASQDILDTVPLQKAAFGMEYDLAPLIFVQDDIRDTEIGDVIEEVANKDFEVDLRKAIIYSEIINRKY